MNLTEQFRNTIDTLQLLEEKEEISNEYEAKLWNDLSLYVRYTGQGKFLIVGYDIEGGFIDREGDEAPEGWFDFTYDPETKEIEIDNVTDEDNYYFDDRNADETVRYIVNEFFKKFGKDWPTIYKNLKKIQEPYAVLNKLSNNLQQQKDSIAAAVRIRMRRSSATKEQIDKIRVLDNFSTRRWFYLAVNAIQDANQQEKWANIPANKVGREDIQELLNTIVDYTIKFFMQPNMSALNLAMGIRT